MSVAANLAYAVVALPLLATLAGLVPATVVERVVRGRAPVRTASAAAAVLGTALATAAALVLWAYAIAHPRTVHESGAALTPTGAVEVVLGARVDGLSASVMLLVCVVALAVQVYSVAYMRYEPRYRSYAAFVSLFTGAMLVVVLSADLIVLLVGWEVMGICSYLLIGHHWERPDHSRAGVKAFLVTKLGDVPFLFGIFALGMGAGSFRIAAVLDAAPRMPHATLYAGTLLLLAGVVGKSAQFPLHTWLPDAMAGPAPVSALIHAATMVAAGAYLVARLYPAYLLSPPALAVLGLVAALTMLGAACAAFAQDDIKRVLAYSTVSQVAYMLGALAVGGYTAGMEHLLVHGAFKALLFLCAGVVAARVGTNLMGQMGGLRRTMPVTFGTMLVGFAALAGVPPTAGFFSKDGVLEAMWHEVGAGHPVVPHWVAAIALVSGLLTALVTAAYATRALLLTFCGEPRSGHNPADVQPLMGWPILVLTVGSLFLGFFGLYDRFLPSWVSSEGSGPVELVLPGVAVGLLSFGLLVAGVAVAYLGWSAVPYRDPVRVLGSLRPLFARGFLVDACYDLVFVRGVPLVARAVLRLDRAGIDARVVDMGRAVRGLGGLVRRTQTGNAQLYVTGVAAGAVLAVLFTLAVVLR